MTPLVFLLLMFVGFGIYGHAGGRAAAVVDTREALRRTILGP
jgi:hypothetical protein